MSKHNSDSDDGKNIPILYTSYEDWYNFCDDEIVPRAVKYKLREVIGTEVTDEQAKQISYTIVEYLQMMEKRDECYTILDQRIRKRFNFIFPQSEIKGLLSDKSIFLAALKHLVVNTTETKTELDSCVDFNLIGVRLPKLSDSQIIKDKYKKNMEKFKKDNASFAAD